MLGLQKKFEEPTTVEFATVDGDAIQVMAPGDAYFAFFSEHASGPVPLFEVDDVHQARRELESAGVQLIGAVDHPARPRAGIDPYCPSGG